MVDFLLSTIKLYFIIAFIFNLYLWKSKGVIDMPANKIRDKRGLWFLATFVSSLAWPFATAVALQYVRNQAVQRMINKEDEKK